MGVCMKMIWIAGAVAAFTVFMGILSFFERKRRKSWDDQNVVHLPFGMALAGMWCGGFLSIPTIVCSMDTDPVFYLFLVMTVLCNCLMMAYVNCVIHYNSDGFIAGNLFGIRKEYAYADVMGIRFGKDIWIHCKGRRILLDESCIGTEAFIDAIDQGYRRTTGRWVPSISRKWDPMNGNMDYPWIFFVLFCFLLLCGISLPILYLYGMNVETDPAQICYRTVFITDCQEEDGELVFYTDDPQVTYTVSYWEDYGRFWPQSKRFHGGNPFYIGTKGDSQNIRYMADMEGNIYVTPETEREVYRENQAPFATPVWIFSLTMFLIGYLGIAIGRDPQKYPRWLRRLIYKDSVFIEVK